MRAPRQDEPASAVTAQGAIRETAQNPAIENAPTITEDVVMEPIGIITRSTQSIVPKTPVALATTPSLGPSAGSTPASAVRPERRALIPIANHRWVDRVTGIRHSLVITGRSAHVPGTHRHHFPEAPGILPELTRPHQVYLGILPWP